MRNTWKSVRKANRIKRPRRAKAQLVKLGILIHRP